MSKKLFSFADVQSLEWFMHLNGVEWNVMPTHNPYPRHPLVVRSHPASGGIFTQMSDNTLLWDSYVSQEKTFKCDPSCRPILGQEYLSDAE